MQFPFTINCGMALLSTNIEKIYVYVSERSEQA